MLDELTSALRPSLALTILFALLLGLAYPATLTGIGQVAFSSQANGSLIRDQDGQVVGSSSLAQRFVSAGYFHPRPSAAGKGYEADNSYGSNLGPTSKALVDRVQADLAALQTPGISVPPDLMTTSASGLDPDISPEAALFQVERVAKARGLEAMALRGLVARRVEQPLLNVLGEPKVNVLELNLALDRMTQSSAQRSGERPAPRS